jgi:chemotaxis signal transduction protein
MSGLVKPSEALRPPAGWEPPLAAPAGNGEPAAAPPRLDVAALMQSLSAPLSTAASGLPQGTIERQGFLIGAARLLVRLDEASELIEMRRIYWLPNAPPLVRGVVNLHGMVVPAVDLHETVMGRMRTGEARHLLILGHGEARVALPLDSVPEVKRFQPAQALADAEPPAWSGSKATGWIRGAFLTPTDGHIWWDLDVARFLASLRA